MPAPDAWLAEPLHVLNVGSRGFAPLTWRDDAGLAGLAFGDAELAASHRELARRLRSRTSGDGAPAARRSVTVLTLHAADPRAREEWLRAVLDAGAARVLFDLPLQGTPGPGAFAFTGALLAEVLSQKRGLACL